MDFGFSIHRWDTVLFDKAVNSLIRLWIQYSTKKDTVKKVQERKKAKQVLDVIQTRVAKSKTLLRYTEAHKEVKRNIRSEFT